MVQSSRKLPHWAVPTTLVASFIAGIALAVGHHFFYSSLSTARVDESSAQQFNISIGTAFSLLVRATLVISIITTYWQIFWHKLRQDLPFVTIDSLASLPTTPYDFLSLRTLRASPLLVALAALSWLIPVAVVFTPGTLTVAQTSAAELILHRYATLNFTHTKAFALYDEEYQDGGGRSPSGYVLEWDGPSIELRRSAMRMAYADEMPLFPSLQANTSWSLPFHGPAVQCRNGRVEETLQRFSEAVGGCPDGNMPLTECPPPNSVDASFYSMESSNLSSYYVAGVIGKPKSFSDSTTPFSLNETLGFNEADVLTLLIAHRDTINSDAWAVLNCSLHQVVRVTKIDLLAPVLRATLPNPGGASGLLSRSTSEAKSYFAAMQTLGDILVGSLWHVHNIRKNARDAGPEIDKGRDTHVLQTSLAFTTEMLPIYDLYTANSTVFDRTALPSLASAIEELFQNMTLSIVQRPVAPHGRDFRDGDEEARILQHIPLRPESTGTCLRGVAIALTALAVAVGAYTIAHTGRSYSNKFSTTVRISRSEKLGLLIAAEDRQSEDPLPQHVAKAEVRFVEDGDSADLDSNERTALRA